MDFKIIYNKNQKVIVDTSAIKTNYRNVPNTKAGLCYLLKFLFLKLKDCSSFAHFLLWANKEKHQNLAGLYSRRDAVCCAWYIQDEFTVLIDGKPVMDLPAIFADNLPNKQKS